MAIFKNEFKDNPKVNVSKEIESMNEKPLEEIGGKSLRDLFAIDNFIISQNKEWKIAFDNILLIVIGYTCVTTVLFVSF